MKFYETSADEYIASKEKYNLVTGASGLLGTELISILLKEGKKAAFLIHKLTVLILSTKNTIQKYVY
jgi:short-subunit dehydrogenase